ncbi:hypothetical protein [Kitasatospora sp. NPDC059571]|uniref:hypothetical protein n=1 Tax=Kitasatospora sp. NPDC059571 TaxID=3346871 RepID=UPI0036BFCB31
MRKVNVTLSIFDAGPVAALNRTVALAEVHGPRAALDLVDDLDLDHHYLFHAIRGDLLARLGRTAEAAQALDTAARLTGNRSERTYLAARRDRLGQAFAPPPAQRHNGRTR